MSESNRFIADEVRRCPLPEGIEAFWIYESDIALKAHAAYKLAKAGDSKSALTLILDLALTELFKLSSQLSKDSIFVAPFAREASGDNAIAQVPIRWKGWRCAQCLMDLFKQESESNDSSVERIVTLIQRDYPALDPVVTCGIGVIKD